MLNSLDILEKSGLAAGPAAALAALAAALLFGCSENAFIGAKGENGQPQIWLSNGSAEGAVVSYRVRFYWRALDEDGSIAFFETVLAGHGSNGFDPQDTTGVDKWHRTAAHDTLLKARADANPQEVVFGGQRYTRYEKTYTFFVRAVDNEGKRSETIARTFTAYNLAPYIIITARRDPQTGVVLHGLWGYTWKGIDPIDDPNNCQLPDSVRCLFFENEWGIDVAADLNAHPELYENRWSRWTEYCAAQTSGFGGETFGDDEIPISNSLYVMAIQSKDEAGAVERIFDRMTNMLQFRVERKAGPVLTVTESFTGDRWEFKGMNPTAGTLSVPPGVAVNFCWSATAESYGGEICCYRYGWDFSELYNDVSWSTPWMPGLLCAPEGSFTSGVHRFYVEVRDNSATITRGLIEVSVGVR